MEDLLFAKSVRRLTGTMTKTQILPGNITGKNIFRWIFHSYAIVWYYFFYFPFDYSFVKRLKNCFLIYIIQIFYFFPSRGRGRHSERQSHHHHRRSPRHKEKEEDVSHTWGGKEPQPPNQGATQKQSDPPPDPVPVSF